MLFYKQCINTELPILNPFEIHIKNWMINILLSVYVG